MKPYIIEFTKDEIDFINNMFKHASNNLNKKLSKIKDSEKRKVKEVDLFYSIVNKFYNVK